MFFLKVRLVTLALLLGSLSVASFAAERVQLANGFSVDCLRHEVSAGRTRLFLRSGGEGSYMDVADTAVLSFTPMVEQASSASLNPPPARAGERSRDDVRHTLSAGEMHPLLAHAGEAHRIDEDLLASVVRAESASRPEAVSRSGARGLMQLMPATASSLGVEDAFKPQQNLDGGAAYLDRLLLRYHDDMVLALAAYNAGPGAVARYHGVPPYRETRAYVARVVREFNRRKLAAVTSTTIGSR